MTTFNKTVSGSLGLSGESRREFGTQYMVTEPRTTDMKEVIKFYREIVKKLSYLAGVGTPLGSITPRWANDRFLDISKNDWYVATDMTAGGWKSTTEPEGSGVGGSGETNTASSAGTGSSVYYTKVGVDLRFNAIKSENSLLTVSVDGGTHDIELTVNEGSIDHDALTNFSADEHRTINDIGSGSTDLWSADKIGTELGGKSDVGHDHDSDYLPLQTIGIGDDNLVEIDAADVADNDYAKFTANGLEGKSYSEVRSDLNVADGADVTSANTCDTPGGPGTDTTAIHDDTSGEISAITEKASPVSADLLIIEDSESSNAKKRVQIGNLPGGSSYSATMIVLTKSTSVNQNCGTTNGTETWWTWDGEIRKDTGFTHSTSVNSSRVQVDADGWYRIRMMGNVQNTGANRATLMGIYRIDGGTTTRYGTIRDYSRGAAYGNMSPGLDTVVELSNGSYIEVGTLLEDVDAAYNLYTNDGTEITDEDNLLIIELVP
jgi:hypothetical protein